jgi:DNA-binding NarL/FixJ family response regulator
MKTRIYVTDDHAMVRRGLSAMIGAEADLEICGEAADCAPATGEISKLRPDVVIVDISLRGNGGLELIKNIRAFDPTIYIVVFSVHDESVYALRVLKAGAKAYVTKQDVAGKVIDAIRKVRKGQIYVSERVSSQILNRVIKGPEEPSDSPVADLSDRELEVVTLIGSGLTTREIAARLHVSVKTVETHRAHIKTKANLSTAAQLGQFCFRWVEESRQAPAETDGNPPLESPAEVTPSTVEAWVKGMKDRRSPLVPDRRSRPRNSQRAESVGHRAGDKLKV